MAWLRSKRSNPRRRLSARTYRQRGKASRARFRHERLRSAKTLVHMRTIKVGKHRVIIGCPVHHKGSRCPVGTVAQAVLHPRGEHKASRVKRNPIAVYNPVRLPLSNVEIRYRRTGGKYNGQLFRHRYGRSVQVYGLKDGSILLKGGE